MKLNCSAGQKIFKVSIVPPFLVFQCIKTLSCYVKNLELIIFSNIFALLRNIVIYHKFTVYIYHNRIFTEIEGIWIHETVFKIYKRSTYLLYFPCNGKVSPVTDADLTALTGQLVATLLFLLANLGAEDKC